MVQHAGFKRHQEVFCVTSLNHVQVALNKGQAICILETNISLGQQLWATREKQIRLVCCFKGRIQNRWNTKHNKQVLKKHMLRPSNHLQTTPKINTYKYIRNHSHLPQKINWEFWYCGNSLNLTTILFCHLSPGYFPQFPGFFREQNLGFPNTLWPLTFHTSPWTRQSGPVVTSPPGP